MTYSAFENSVQDGDPLYRFLFSIGVTVYAYTTGPDIASDGTNTYEPAPIVMGELSQTNELNKDPLSLEFPRTNAFARLFLGGVPEQVTSVSVFRGHQGDVAEDFILAWKGKVSASVADGDKVSIDCENIFSTMQRAGLRARYQKLCRHALYQRGCELLAADYGDSADVTAAAGFDVTIPSLLDSNAPAEDYYVGGMLETVEGFQRLIIEQDGDTLRLFRPLQPLIDDVNDSVAGATVTLYPGCDHTRTTCETKFDNLDNFGGFPWIPSKNPFGNDVTGSIS